MTTSPASVVVRCVDLDANLDFFRDALGCRVQLVTPADDPRCVVVERDGVRFELRRAGVDDAISIVVETAEPESPDTLTAPNGSTVVFRHRSGAVVIPDSDPSLAIIGPTDGGFGMGRAGMHYRDLLPDRWGGRFIASHIRIDEGGDVADWVHFHRIRFQMIFVAAGWVEVVYEDQGEPFRMVAGDCVLQPPEIRHRVLRSSPGLEVIEIGCPAEHDTLADHVLTLPTPAFAPNRDFGGQRFVRHIAAETPASSWLVDGVNWRDTGIAAATDGLASAFVVSSDGSDPDPVPLTNGGEFALCVGLAGAATLDIEGHGAVTVASRTSVALPPGSVWRYSESSDDHEALMVTLPDDAVRLA